MDMLDVNTLRENDLRGLYGVLRPELSMTIEGMWSNVSMTEVLPLQHNLIDCALRNALTLMINGELEQWKYFAKVLNTVEAHKHGDFARLFVAENETREDIIRSRIVNEELNLLLLDETQIMAIASASSISTCFARTCGRTRRSSIL